MSRKIRRVGVLGSGLMGAGIAAQVAGAGIPVLMLDMVPPLTPKDEARGQTADDPRFRNKIASANLAQLAKAKPAALYSPRFLPLIEVGNFEDDWSRLAECDWVVEAVVERLDVKQSLFERLEEVWRPGSVISSNTSGLSLAEMVAGRSEAFRQHFLITHFFNPVRYMHLLELVAGEATLPEIVDAMADFGRRRLGKGIVYGEDTPNFVGNRIGVFGMAATLHTMLEMDYQIDEVDAITGEALGRPKSATFGTADLVGLDTLAHTFRTSREGCPDDEGQPYYQVPEFLQALLDGGQLGRKSGAGTYRLQRGPEGKVKQVLDWRSGEYRPVERPALASLKAALRVADVAERMRTVVWSDDRAGAFAWRLMRETLSYCSRRYGEITGSLEDMDRAMRWGYNWQLGPFESWDALGVAKVVERMKAEGVTPAPWVDAMLAAEAETFYRSGDEGQEVWDPSAGAYRLLEEPADHLTVARCKSQDAAVVFSRPGAVLVDLGDGIGCLELRSRSQPAMNPVDPDMIEGLHEALEVAPEHFRGLVVHHDGDNFSAGANLVGVLEASRTGAWEELGASIRRFQDATTALRRFQDATTALRRSELPVVAAPFGYTLGGGAELALGADRIYAHAETYMGLVEVGVGLVPAGGGHLFLLERLLEGIDKPINDNLPFVARAFETIAMAKVATSAEEARDRRFLIRGDQVEMLRERQLWGAKRRVLAMAETGYRPPLPRTFRLPGAGGIATLRMQVHNMTITHWASEHDAVIAGHVARILCGGDTTPSSPVSEGTILDLEREAFLSLCGEEKSQQRMEHMLKTGKPLRN